MSHRAGLLLLMKKVPSRAFGGRIFDMLAGRTGLYLRYWDELKSMTSCFYREVIDGDLARIFQFKLWCCLGDSRC